MTTTEQDDLQSVQMLGLKLPTDPRWVRIAEIELEEILSDHAYCEQKAAMHCMLMISRYPEYTRLVDDLAPIVTEEWGHFRQVLAEMKKRNLTLGRQRKDVYVNKLRSFMKTGVSREEKLLEELLVAGLIEARSCERFRLLSINIKEIELRDFYHKFMVSEAGHYVLFLDLARSYFGKEKAEARWEEYLEHEAEIIGTLELRGDRMH